jgi:hypothetical protein
MSFYTGRPKGRAGRGTSLARLYFSEDLENLELYDLVWTQIKSR